MNTFDYRLVIDFILKMVKCQRQDAIFGEINLTSKLTRHERVVILGQKLFLSHFSII